MRRDLCFICFFILHSSIFCLNKEAFVFLLPCINLDNWFQCIPAEKLPAIFSELYAQYFTIFIYVNTYKFNKEYLLPPILFTFNISTFKRWEAFINDPLLLEYFRWYFYFYEIKSLGYLGFFPSNFCFKRVLVCVCRLCKPRWADHRASQVCCGEDVRDPSRFEPHQRPSEASALCLHCQWWRSPGLKHTNGNVQFSRLFQQVCSWHFQIQLSLSLQSTTTSPLSLRHTVEFTLFITHSCFSSGCVGVLFPLLWQ